MRERRRNGRKEWEEGKEGRDESEGGKSKKLGGSVCGVRRII